MDRTAHDALKKHHEELVRKSPHTKEEQDAIVEDFSEQVASLLGKVFAEFKTVAEPIRAMELAIQKCDWAIAALRFAIPFLHSEIELVRVGFDGETTRGYRQTIVYAGEALRINRAMHGPHFSLKISQENLKTLEGSGFFEISAALAKPEDKLTKFEKKVLDAVHWYGKGQHEFIPEDRLLHCMTAIECLLTRQGSGDPVASTVSEAASIILTKDIPQRIKNKKEILRLYSERSNLSHGFSKAVTGRDANTLLHVGIYVIQFAVRNFKIFNEPNDLSRWLDELRLSGPPSEPVKFEENSPEAERI